MDVTKVKFVRDDNGDVLAVFPELEWDYNGNLTCYVHIGQHSGCHPIYLNYDPVTQNEYQALRNELESIGYNLDIINEQ